MTPAIAIWLGLVLSSTLGIVAAVILAAQVLRHDDDLSWPARIGAALLPPWAAVEGTRRGRFVAAGLFTLAVVAYAAFQVAAASVTT